MKLEKIGFFIAQQRKTQHLTQQELANQLHVTDKAVSKWETGRSFPDLLLLQPIADALQVSLMELLNGERITHDEDLKINDPIEEIVAYSTEEKQRKAQKLNLLFASGILFILLSVLNLQFMFLSEFISNSHIEQGLTGALFGLGIGFEIVAFYLNNNS